MPDTAKGAVTALLEQVEHGDPEASSRLWSLVYEELRGIAGRQTRDESPANSLQVTDLVHEVFLRLQGGATLNRKNRPYFFRAVAQAMRRILIEHGRRRSGRPAGVPNDLPLEFLSRSLDATLEQRLDAQENALNALARENEIVFDVILFRYFNGFTIEQTAELLDVSPMTVKRHTTYGKAWLHSRICASVGNDTDRNSSELDAT